MIPISYNVRSLSERKATTAAAVLGIALVVFVLSSSMMLAAGIQKTMATSGRDDQAIVMRKGSDNELSSIVDSTMPGVVLAQPGVKVGEGGVPLGVGEVVVVAAMEKKGTAGSVSNVQMRGVPESALAFRSGLTFVAGRPPKPGSDEAAVGTRLRGKFTGLDLGESFEPRKNLPIQVVGIFADGGSSYESEVWMDLDTLRGAFRRDGMVSSIRARLDSPAAFEAFETAVEEDPRIGLEAMRETEFYEKASEDTAMFLSVLGGIISFFFAAGAMVGAMITMYASIASRQREVGTLRALGFRRRTILGSFLLESALIALIGGAIGTVASLGMGSLEFSMMNQSTWSEIVFRFTPTGRILVTALVLATAMGLVGGFLPALRAARLSTVEAMRE